MCACVFEREKEIGKGKEGGSEVPFTVSRFVWKAGLSQLTQDSVIFGGQLFVSTVFHHMITTKGPHYVLLVDERRTTFACSQVDSLSGDWALRRIQIGYLCSMSNRHYRGSDRVFGSASLCFRKMQRA